MISIDIHRQRFSKNWRMSCRFVLSPLGKLSWTYGMLIFKNTKTNFHTLIQIPSVNAVKRFSAILVSLWTLKRFQMFEFNPSNSVYCC